MFGLMTTYTKSLSWWTMAQSGRSKMDLARFSSLGLAPYYSWWEELGLSILAIVDNFQMQSG
jgi:hypothetical protein